METRDRAHHRQPQPPRSAHALERCPTAGRRLWSTGLTGTEMEALELLTHAPGELYVERIADALGPAGRLARVVKLADLNDHLAHPTLPADTPPYAWARKRLAMGRDRGALAGRGPSDPAAASATSLPPHA